jgi:hypothetical protein
MWSFLKEIWLFALTRKKMWMLPVWMVLVLFGSLLVFTQGSVVAPFIYALF